MLTHCNYKLTRCSYVLLTVVMVLLTVVLCICHVDIISYYHSHIILKTFALSQILYVSSVFHIPEDIVTEIENIMFNFLWNGNQIKVKKKVSVQN